jgi:acyl-CoA synthetase (AMP-forming)/AMP-acid ligase II
LVRDAVALGIEDPRLGQRIVLSVSPEGPADKFDREELTAALKKRLPLYMVPRDIEVLDELPRSPNGKFDRQAIRARLEAR